jgi:hypothetical protein
LRYIDFNPVKAGLVCHSSEHEFGSASVYQSLKGSPWLTREWVQVEACRRAKTDNYSHLAYLTALNSNNDEEVTVLDRLVRIRIQSKEVANPWEDLVGKSPASTVAWMQRKARLADGHRLGLPVCGHEALNEALFDNLYGFGACLVQINQQTDRGEELA